MLYTELFIHIQVWHFIVLLLRHSFPIVFCMLHFLEKNYCVLSGVFFWQNFHCILTKKKAVPYNFAVAGKFAHIHISTAEHFFSLSIRARFVTSLVCVWLAKRVKTHHMLLATGKNKYIYIQYSNNHMCVVKTYYIEASSEKHQIHSLLRFDGVDGAR